MERSRSDARDSAQVPDGVSDTIVRIVTENSGSLKFTSHGFEKE
jgi:hypothetical protein